jgi:redox-sensitive bicupin YhaK (pirin superfamily)
MSHAYSNAKQPRRVTEVITSQRLLEGGGFPVTRPFPTRRLSYVDPFLLFDHMGPVEWAPGQAIGAPAHPHRGFETVTYMLDGVFEHQDSAGHRGVLRPGDVQWMTAGRGIIHSELPEPSFKAKGGVMNGIQIWVNLPRRDKMMAPRYQDIAAAKIPEAQSDDGKVKVRVIAGEAMGYRAVIDTRVPIVYLHYVLAPGGAVVQPLAANLNALVYVISGSVRAGEEQCSLNAAQMAILGRGDEVSLAVRDDADAPASVIVLAGQPLNEPVVRHGPFVMNSQEEIDQAILDYRSGRLTRLA